MKVIIRSEKSKILILTRAEIYWPFLFFSKSHKIFVYILHFLFQSEIKAFEMDTYFGFHVGFFQTCIFKPTCLSYLSNWKYLVSYEIYINILIVKVNINHCFHMLLYEFLSTKELVKKRKLLIHFYRRYVPNVQTDVTRACSTPRTKNQGALRGG